MRRTKELRVGDYISWNDAVWRITGVGIGSVTLQQDREITTVLTSTLLTDPTVRPVESPITSEKCDRNFDLNEQTSTLGPWSTEQASGVLTSTGASQLNHDHVLRRMHLVQRYLTGYPQGFPDSTSHLPDTELGPGDGEKTRTIRMARLAQELQVTPRQAHELVKRFQEHDPLGLVDQRKNRKADPLLQCPPELREVILNEIARSEGASKTPTRTLMANIRRTMKDAHPQVKLPKETAFRKYIKALSSSRARHLSTKSQRSNRSRGDVSPVRGRALRPFDRVEIDATVLDVMALHPEAGIQSRPTLLIAIDVYSRSIVAWRVIPEKEASLDVSLLLYQMMTPKIVPASWGELAQWRFGVPAHLVLGSEELTTNEMFAGVPTGKPTSILVDWGMANVSADMHRVANQVGITIEMARPATGSDKPHVESSFGRINKQFASQLPGYTGSSIHDRGEHSRVEAEACLTVEEIEDAFGRWVACVYQNTAHHGLPIPGHPGQFLTPNEAYDIAIASSGILPVSLDRNTAISLLRSDMRPIHHYGFEIDHIRYNSPELQLQHGIPSPFDPDKNTWPVRWDPRDRSIAWIWKPNPTEPHSGTWLEVRSDTLSLVGPMSQAQWDSIKKHLGQKRSGTPTPEEVQQAEDILFTGIPKPGKESRAARQRAISESKVAAATRDRARWGDTTPELPTWEPIAETSLNFHDPDLYDQMGDDTSYEDEDIYTAEDGLA